MTPEHEANILDKQGAYQRAAAALAAAEKAKAPPEEIARLRGVADAAEEAYEKAILEATNDSFA